jgi:hypothetical protein
VKKGIALALFVSTVSLSPAEAARVKVVHRPHRTTVVVRSGFPLHRALPAVVVRPAPVVRVAPRVYLAPVVFTAAVIATLPPPAARPWAQSEVLEREDGWTDFTMNVSHHGTGMLLEIDRGTAQLSFAEIVFENGDTQVVDFNDKVHRTGTYSLLDFRAGRKVDHVRVVAKSDSQQSEIRLHLLS